MSFLFNFDAPESDPADTGSPEPCKDLTDVSPAFEVKDFLNSLSSKLDLKQLTFGKHTLNIVDTSSIEEKILEEKDTLSSSEKIIKAVVSHSDLVAGEYEGGLKIWECGLDLISYLSSHPSGTSLDIKRKLVLELGCGVGLPGLYCIKCGAQRVDFQDYNEEVLQILTHTNVVNNSEGGEVSSQFFAGDWASFSQLAEQQNLRYDIILSAETIYNTENYPKLHQVFKATLAQNGLVLLAAKEYYFGVGGSIAAFEEFVTKQNCFSIVTMHTITEGIARKILCLRHLSSQEPS
ncbi:histidine protein methyltransferase 1 homolog [Physella acuta]|uniref:histidine protein methyltransferase 1 homolog n=1 Tax=Physella acuta TaxID=109671 RepID=UPI0027DE7F1D|nr:histidine protein methyltransferase 1 homolog [Physella acuta]